jgi:TPR repeat protein
MTNLLMALWLMLISFGVMAGVNEGMVAAQKGDYATAIQEWKPLAEQGDYDAQYNLAVMYRDGKGVIKNLAEAEKWFTKSAKQENIYAQFELGLLNRERGNLKSAIYWYTQSAELGWAPAQWNLGVMYYEGTGVVVSMESAKKWWIAAADQGHPSAIKALQEEFGISR